MTQLPVFTGVRDLVYSSIRLRHLGMMEFRHPWRPGQTVSWATMTEPPLQLWREADLSEQAVRVEYRTVTLRMKEIVFEPGPRFREQRWAALMLEAGRVADLMAIDAFFARRSGESPHPLFPFDGVRYTPSGQATAIYTTATYGTATYRTAAEAEALQREVRESAARLRESAARFRGWLRTADAAASLEARNLARAIEEIGRGLAARTGTEDRRPPRYEGEDDSRKPLAPLADWMKRADALIEEAKA